MNKVKMWISSFFQWKKVSMKLTFPIYSNWVKEMSQMLPGQDYIKCPSIPSFSDPENQGEVSDLLTQLNWIQGWKPDPAQGQSCGAGPPWCGECSTPI